MSATLDIRPISRAGFAQKSSPRTSYSVESNHWGYTIRSGHPAPFMILLVQALVWVAGCVLIAMAFGLWLLPAAINQGPVLGLKLGSSVLMLAAAAYCMWYASRGVMPELQIDTSRGEVREVVRNRTGRPTQVGLYGFDAIGGVFIDRGPGFGARRGANSTLVLRYRNTPQTLFVASGNLADLTSLRDRLGRDLMVLGRQRNEPVDLIEPATSAVA